MGFIYKIVNNLNGKVYIGKTDSCRTIEDRFNAHIRESKRKHCEKRPLYSAMRKYGIENFSCHLIEETNDTASREMFWIEHYCSYGCSGYNATKGGDGKAYLDYDKIREYFINNYENKPASQIAIDLGIDYGSLSKYVKSLGYDIKLNSGRFINKIKVINLDTNEIFNSQVEAAKHLITTLQLDTSNVASIANKISLVTRGIRKTVYGYRWARFEDIDKL